MTTHRELPTSVDVVSVECLIKSDPDMTCDDYISTITSRSEMCSTDVVFSWNIENTGLACIDIEKIEGKVSNTPWQSVQFEEAYSCQQREFCPQQNMVIPDVRYNFNICEWAGQSFPVKLAWNGKKGDGKVLLGNIALDNNVAPTQAPMAEEPCRVEDNPAPATPCEKGRKLKKMVFSFNPATCEDSKNGQAPPSRTRNLKNKGGNYKYFSCVDSDDVAGEAIVLIGTQYDDDTYANEALSAGSTVEISDPSTNVFVTVQDMSGNVVQKFKFHSSCSIPLSTQDTFGSLKLLQFIYKN
jgi:hypothetical protein